MAQACLKTTSRRCVRCRLNCKPGRVDDANGPTLISVPPTAHAFGLCRSAPVGQRRRGRRGPPSSLGRSRSNTAKPLSSQATASPPMKHDRTLNAGSHPRVCAVKCRQCRLACDSSDCREWLISSSLARHAKPCCSEPLRRDLNRLTTNVPTRGRIASIASEDDALILPHRANPDAIFGNDTG
jgi:hypothetical protein